MAVAVVVESGLYTLFSGGFDSFTYDSTGIHGTVDQIGPRVLGTGKRHRFPKIGIHKVLGYEKIKISHGAMGLGFWCIFWLISTVAYKCRG